MASQQPFILNPSYSGPMVIAETLRKMKSNNGLNRMLSTYNKRFFVLDLNHATFYYLPEKGAHFANSTAIPLSSIIGIKVTKQAEGLEEDKIWKHEFVITTKKKSFELISDCRAIMEKILFAFSNLINTKTNRPLFNWNHYKNIPQDQPSPCNLPIYKSPDASPQKGNEETFASPEQSPVKTQELQPEQKGKLSAELRPNKEEEVTQPSPKESCESDDQKENKESQEEGKKKYVHIQMRRKGNSNAALRGKGFELEEKAAVQQEVSPQKEEQVESGQQEQEREEQVEVRQSPSPARTGEKIQIKVEMLNLEKIENDIKDQHQRTLGSYRETSQHNPGESVRRNSNRLQVKNNKSASMKNMVGTTGDFVGCNEVDLSHHKNRTTKHCESQESQPASDGKKMSFGTGAVQEASRFSLFKKTDQNNMNLVNVKKSENNDDDWDNEMFGDGKHQISPLKPNNREQRQRQPETKYMSSDKKTQLSQKRSEFVATRQGTYNDWDDEL